MDVEKEKGTVMSELDKKIKTRSRKPIPKGGLYRKKKGFRPFGKVDKVKPVETRLHTKSK